MTAEHRARRGKLVNRWSVGQTTMYVGGLSMHIIHLRINRWSCCRLRRDVSRHVHVPSSRVLLHVRQLRAWCNNTFPHCLYPSGCPGQIIRKLHILLKFQTNSCTHLKIKWCYICFRICKNKEIIPLHLQ